MNTFILDKDSIVIFIILYNLYFYIGKYFKLRRQKEELRIEIQKFDLMFNSLEKCLKRQDTQ